MAAQVMSHHRAQRQVMGGVLEPQASRGEVGSSASARRRATGRRRCRNLTGSRFGNHPHRHRQNREGWQIEAGNLGDCTGLLVAQ